MRELLEQICFLGSFLVLGGYLLSCSGHDDPPHSAPSAQPTMTISDSNTNHFDVAEFERNRELWTSKNIQHYKIIIGAEGFLTNFPEEVLIEVRSQRAQSIKSLSKTGNDGTNTYKDYDTVEKLFRFIDGQSKQGTKHLWVTYDSGYGYPNRIEVDQDGYRGNDDELLLEVKDFERVGVMR